MKGLRRYWNGHCIAQKPSITGINSANKALNQWFLSTLCKYGFYLYYEFENNPFALNEAIELDNIFSLDESPREPISEFYSNLDEYIKDADKHDDESLLSQPWVDGFVNELEYSYDYGDSWAFLITARLDIEYLLKDKRVTVKAVKESIKKVCTLARPVIIASDGYPLIDDVGGLQGYIEFLKEIENGNEELNYWSSSKDWKKKIDKNAL